MKQSLIKLVLILIATTQIILARPIDNDTLSTKIEDYARAGNRVKETVTVDEGLLDGLQHTMEPLLRFSGDVLTPEQAKLLKLFQRPLAQF
ncbi:unnamed protein product [Rotaria socialis]